jgi:hypothetical protein
MLLVRDIAGKVDIGVIAIAGWFRVVGRCPGVLRRLSDERDATQLITPIKEFDHTRDVVVFGPNNR